MLLLIVGFLLPGEPPKADDPVEEFTSFLVDKRGSVLAQALLIGLGSGLFLFWAGALRSRLEAAGRTAMTNVFFGGAVASATLNLVGVAIFAGTAFEAASLGDDVLNRALFDIGTDVLAISGFAVATFFAAASLAAAGTGALPRWAVSTGLVAAAVQLVTTLAVVASSGFFAAGEAFGFLGFFVAVVWIIAVSIAMLRSEPAAAGT